MYTTVIAFCAICDENTDALIGDCDFCAEKIRECEHLICTLCSTEV